MLRYLTKKLFVRRGRRTTSKSRKHVRGTAGANGPLKGAKRAAKQSRSKKLIDDRGSTLLSESYDFNGSEYVPHDIDVAKWVLGVHSPSHSHSAHTQTAYGPKTGYTPIQSISRLSPIRRATHSQCSPLTPPPTPVRSSSRMAFQRIHNYGHPLHSYPVRLQPSIGQNKIYVTNRINKSSAKPKKTSPFVTNEKSNKTKNKTNKSSAKKNEQKSKHKSDRSGSKSRRSHTRDTRDTRDRSLSRRRQVCDDSNHIFSFLAALGLRLSLAHTVML